MCIRDRKWVFDYDDDQYVFPAHIVTTDERPDILIYSDSLKTVILVELTCPAEEGILAARERKLEKYHETLVPLIKEQNGGWSVELRTIEVGVRGLASQSMTRCIRQLGIQQTQKIVKKVSTAVAACSCYIQKAARSTTWSEPTKVVIK